MRTLLFVLLAVSCFAIDSEFDIEANFSEKNRDLFKARLSATADVSVLGIRALSWVSSSIEGSILNASVSADVIAATHLTGKTVSLGFTSITFPVVTFGTYISGKGTFNPITDLLQAMISGTVSVEASVGLIGFIVPGVMEVDSDGKVVGGISFSKDWTDFIQVTGTGEGINAFKSSMKDADKGVISEYVVSSKKAGYLKFAHTPVSPNSLEVIFEIKDYQYASPKNHLELVFVSAAVTAEGKGKFDADIALNEIGKDFFSYSAVRAEAEVDGKSSSVKIKATAEADLDANYRVADAVKAQLTGLFKARGAVSYDYKKIAFPANAKNIIFDPAIGAGKKSVYNSASSVVLSIVAVLLAVFLLF